MRNTLEYASKNGNYDYLVIVPKNMGNPNTYAYQEDGLNLSITKMTVWRILNKEFRKPRRVKNGFFLSKKNKMKRVEFCKKMI